MNEVDLKVVSNKVCKKVYKKDLTDKMICAGGSAEGGKDSCQVFIYLLIFYYRSICRSFSLIEPSLTFSLKIDSVLILIPFSCKTISYGKSVFFL